MTDRPHRLLILISSELLAEIESFRRFLVDLPSRTEAIRRLIRAGLDAPSEIAQLEDELADAKGEIRSEFTIRSDE